MTLSLTTSSTSQHIILVKKMIRYFLWALTTSFLLVNVVLASEQAQTIGQSTLVIGSAYIDNAANPVPLKRGTKIKVGDKIVTRSNGHVHIRFNDEGILSIRPNSQLIIENYRYDQKNPQQSTVKFSLVKGVARSVSGKAAKAARARFRMNTPIAAIGVRGTDFVISASSYAIKAFVNEGTIVVSPFSSLCSAASLGPCASNAVELHGNTNQLLELHNRQSLATIRSLNTETLPAFLYSSNLVTAEQTEEQNEEDSNTEELAESSENTEEASNPDSDTVAASDDQESNSASPTADDNQEPDTASPAADDNQESSSATPTVSDTQEPDTATPAADDTQESSSTTLPADDIQEPSTETLPENNPLEPDTNVFPEPELEVLPETETITDPDLSADLTNPTNLSYFTPAGTVSSEVLAERQMVWGRWTEGLGTNNKISTSYAIASAGRVITVGDVAQGLFREGEAGQSINPNLGQVSFDLHFADVDYFTATGSSQVNVSGGYLSIDFNEKSFSTGLTMDHEETGAINFSSSGSVFENGIFRHQTDTTNLSGATSFDGTEAGYQFSEELQNGTIKGSTLWGQP